MILTFNSVGSEEKLAGSVLVVAVNLLASCRKERRKERDVDHRYHGV